MVPNSSDFESKLSELLQDAKSKGWIFVDVSSGNLHQLTGGYPQTKTQNHAMPTCCHVMRKMLKSNDEILHESDSGNSTKLVIRYHIK